jgi:hypothetical protein
VALALVLIVSGAAGVRAASVEPAVRQGASLTDWGNPGPAPNPCENPAALAGVSPERSRVVCGTAGPDRRLTVPGGKGDPAIAVYGLGGSDRIRAKNGPADIHSGPGQDTAVVLSERYDKWGSDTERVYGIDGRRIASANAAPSPPIQFDPSKVPLSDVRTRLPDVKCGGYDDGSWYVRFADEPLLRAFNTIPGKVEFQQVAFRARLYKWDAGASRWAPYTTTVWYWDETYDVDWAPFFGNFWRRFDTLERRFVRFLLGKDQPGYYRVAVAYYWYPTQAHFQAKAVNVPAFAPRAEWVRYHFGDYSNESTAQYHADRYCAFGVPKAGP